MVEILRISLFFFNKKHKKNMEVVIVNLDTTLYLLYIIKF